MTSKAAGTTDSDSHATRPKSTLGVRAAFMLILDTSTRLFVPSVGGTVLGLWLDVTNDTRPWFTIVGVTGGTLVAFALVYAQIKAVDKQKDRSE